jgi:hypothetical protein
MTFAFDRPSLALALAIGDFNSKVLACDASTTICFFTVAARLFGPPCAAVTFGRRDDDIGRRRSTCGPLGVVRPPRHTPRP